MKPGRVIVTYARSLMSLVIAQSLSRRGVEVIGCDDVDFSVMSFSKHVDSVFTHPSIDDDEEGFFECFLENIKKYKPEDDRPYLLMPVFSNTQAIARHREMFAPYINVAAPLSESIEMVFPKENLAETALGAGVNVPKTIHTDDTAALTKRLRSFKPPLMLKPVAGVGGRGIETFDTVEQAIEAHSAFVETHNETPLMQEKVEGEDYCFTGLFKDGELLAHMAYRNLKSFPADTGAGTLRETVDDKVFLDQVKKLMSSTRWTGVAEIDFLWSGDVNDAPILIEVNPRFWAGLFHSVKSGIDFPWLQYQLFTTGGITAHADAEIGAITKTPGLWLASAAQEIAASDFHFDRLKDAWKSGAGGGFKERLSNVAAILGDTIDLDDACFRLFDSYDVAKNSSDELSEYNDPFTGLGILFIISSLARHGRLPDEVKI